VSDVTDFWRWLTFGLGGLVGMIVGTHGKGLVMTDTQLEDLERYARQLTEIAAAQRKRKSPATTKEDPNAGGRPATEIEAPDR
jgi:hypothetical protein